MAETGKLAPEKIIEKKHVEAAFDYIRDHGQQRAGIWYYQKSPDPIHAWVVNFDGEKYYHRETLKLANLFALKEAGAIGDEEPPFSAAYDEHILNNWLEYEEIDRIWGSVGLTARRNVYVADGEHGGLVPEEIIKKRHVELAFKYIRERNQQEEGIRYYKTRPNVENAWVVEFDGEEYYHRESLKLSYLFALREIGEITNEEPPFDAVYKKYVSSLWIDLPRIRSIWISMGFDPRDSKNAAGSSSEEKKIMTETDRLAPGKIIEKKHAEAAFKYIREHGQQEGDIRYYKTRPKLDAWVVEFEGEKYFHWQTLKLAQLFALKDAGVIKDEESPFPIAYREHISGILLKSDEADKIWDSMGCTPRRNVYTADGEHGGLAPEKIIKRKHAEAAFNYIREYGRQKRGIWYYKDRDGPGKIAWVVEFEGEEYWQREALRLANLFALRDGGEIKDEVPPFLSAYKEHVMGAWLRYHEMAKIWNSMGITPQRNVNTAGGEYNEERQDMSNNIVRNGYNLLRQFRQIIFHGPPGTGKTYSAKEVLVELFKSEFNGELPERGERWNIVQFHPSYNYEDFVRGIKVGTRGEEIKYETENRIFGKMCENAVADKHKRPYALIVDEINRANVSAVLGELIYALEYRGKPIDTPYAIGEGESKSAELTIPENLYVIGTMNAADRTIGQIDYAVRRRFAFVHCPPNGKLIPNDDDIRRIFSKVAVLFDSTNHLSQDFDGTDVQVGHSYFLPDKSQKTPVREQISRKIQYQVVPILREYVKDGVLLSNSATMDAIDEINDLAEGLLYAPKDERRETDEDVADDDNETSSSSGKEFFYWRSGDSGRRGVAGVGRVAFSVIKDFIQHNSQMDVNAINDEIRSDKQTRDFVYTENNRPAGQYFTDPIVHQGKELFVYDQWGARNNNESLWNNFRETMKSHGYSIGLCHLVNLGENNGDSPSRTWEDCRKYKIVSGRGKGYPTAIGNLKKGDLLFVRLAESSDDNTGYIACAEVEEEKIHIEEVRTGKNGEGELLANTTLDNGQTYRQKYTTAFDKEEPDYAVKVNWLRRKPRNEVISGIASARQFHISKIQKQDIIALLTAFDIPYSGK